MSEHFVLITDTFLGNPDNYEGVDYDKLIGGAEINLYQTAQLLIDMGHDVTILQQDTGNNITEYDGINIRYLSVPDLPGRAKQVAFNLTWQRAVPDDAISHAHSMDYVIPFIGYVDSVNQQGLTWDVPNGNRFTTRIKKHYVKRTLESGACVRASDNSFLTYTQSQYTTARNQVFPVPNGVDTERFAPADFSPESLGINPNGSILILFPRTVRIARGAHLFVDAIAALRDRGYDVLGLFLGAEDINDAEIVRDRINQYDLHNSVKFLGHIPHDRMHEYYNAVDLVTIPTYHSEGSSIACIEAMACGKPVVVTDVGGLKELIYQSEIDGGLKVKPTASALTRALETLVSDPDRRQTFGERARERALKYYTQERWENQMKTYFETVIDRRGRRRSK
jgi:glycosyltransferase involved in cell wall biosynthesis